MPQPSSDVMQAVAVIAGRPGSLHLREVPRPRLDDVPGGRGVLVDVIRVGVDATDREIVDAEYGAAPEGDEHLILGHESLGRVAAVGPNARASLRPGTLVVATVRRPGGSIYDRIGLPDMTTDEEVLERGINGLHGFLAEAFVEDATYLVPLPESLEAVGVLLEPLSIAEKGIRQSFEIQRRLRLWRPSRAAVMGAGTIGLLFALALRLRGLDVVVYSRREPPYLNSELVEALGGRYLSSGSVTLDDLAEAGGPLDLIVDATGHSPLALGAARILARNGVLVLTSVTGGDETAELPTDAINQGFVLGNKVMVGTVNAARDDFEEAVEDLLRAEAFHPGWLERLITTRIDGLGGHAEMLRRLVEDESAIKVVVEVDRG
ncbi:MAG TPA: glucose 1-dehydrogenase [Candidatus Limnocylindrales bacterium]|nr:glucose 1-dehydrogenase [Candidatus Limnocylindrales bacterium]